MISTVHFVSHLFDPSRNGPWELRAIIVNPRCDIQCQFPDAHRFMHHHQCLNQFTLNPELSINEIVSILERVFISAAHHLVEEVYKQPTLHHSLLFHKLLENLSNELENEPKLILAPLNRS